MSLTTKSKLTKLASFALCAALALGALAMTGCAPKASSEADGNASKTEESSGISAGTMMMDFLENSSGDFPDTFTNTTMLNAGNRGCNACHEDLFAIMSTLEPQHIIVSTGYGKQGTIYDCFGCHTRHVAETGPYLGDLLHASHYSNETFVEGNGNCWSCHAVTTDQTYSRLGRYDFLLWEDMKYSPKLGGYVDGGAAYNEWWNTARGWESGFFTGVMTDPEGAMEISWDQKITSVEDAFVCDNFIFDPEVVASTNNDIAFIGGVNNPRSFTYEELKAMPQTTIRATQTCSTNGLGGSLITNGEWTGVSMKYLIEQCGGLSAGTNQIRYNAPDAEEGTWGADVLVDQVWDDIIALEMNGEPLTINFGPYLAVSPGQPAGAWTKHVEDVTFTTVDNPTFLYHPSWYIDNEEDLSTHYWINAGWFENDGTTYSMSEGVTLNGWAFGQCDVKEGFATDKIKISLDLGETWQTFDVPADHDPYQWSTFEFHWDPPAPGTYIIKLQACNENGTWIKGDKPDAANLLINVTE